MEDEDNEWKRLIDNWQNSNKHKKLKNKLRTRRMYQLTTTEIQSMLKSCSEFNSLSDEDKEAFDWLDPSFQQGITKKDVISSLIDLLVKWYFYMKRYEMHQQYELCAKIRDTIDMEVDDARRLVSTYFIVEEDDEDIYHMLKGESKKKVYENYDNWLNFIEEDEQ